MSSRALSLATVMLLIGCCTAEWAQAQENLEAGKSPSQIFAGTCTACHKSPRGLLKTVAPGSLAGFLREHYTTSSAMAGVLATYLVSNGATDTRYGGKDGAKEGAKEGSKEGTKDGAREAKSDAKPGVPPEQPDRFGRKRLARPAEAPETVKPEADGQVPAQAGERSPEGRKTSAKQRFGKGGKGGLEAAPKEAPKTETPKTEAPKADTAKEEPASAQPRGEPAREEPANAPSKGETAKVDAGKSETKSETKPETKPEPATPAADGPSQSATAEPPKDGATVPAAQSDSVPPVTSAQPANVPPPASTTSPAEAASPSSAPAAPAAVSSGGGSEPAADSSSPSAPQQPAQPAVTASAPPSPAVTPAGPPVPPISQ